MSAIYVAERAGAFLEQMVAWVICVDDSAPGHSQCCVQWIVRRYAGRQQERGIDIRFRTNGIEQIVEELQPIEERHA